MKIFSSAAPAIEAADLVHELLFCAFSSLVLVAVWLAFNAVCRFRDHAGSKGLVSSDRDTSTKVSQGPLLLRRRTEDEGSSSTSFSASLLSAKIFVEPLLVEVMCLLHWGRTAAAVELLRAARSARKSMGEQAPPACFRAVMQRLARTRSSRVIFDRLIEEMCHTGCPTDALTEGCCVRYLCREALTNITNALHAYDSMLAIGLTPDLRTVECLAAACLRAKRYEAVKELVAGLQDYDLQPSAVLYVTLIVACGATGDVDRGLRTLERMQRDLGNVPQLACAYARAVQMCASNGQVSKAEGLLLEARRTGLKLGPAPAVALITAAVKTDDSRLALRMATHLRKEGLARSSLATNVLSQLAERPGSHHLVEKVRAEMGFHAPMPGTGFPVPDKKEQRTDFFDIIRAVLP